MSDPEIAALKAFLAEMDELTLCRMAIPAEREKMGLCPLEQEDPKLIKALVQLVLADATAENMNSLWQELLVKVARLEAAEGVKRGKVAGAGHA
jgi:hypothetical protein